MLPNRCLGAHVQTGRRARTLLRSDGDRRRLRRCRVPIPLEAGAQHEVDDVAVLDTVFFEQLPVCESFATQEKTLGVRGRSTGLRRELRFNI